MPTLRCRLLWICSVVFAVSVKTVSIILAVLAAVVLGHGIADILYTALVICDNTSNAGLSICPLGDNLAILFTWIAPSVWCSIFVSLFYIIPVTIVTVEIGCSRSQLPLVACCILTMKRSESPSH